MSNFRPHRTAPFVVAVIHGGPGAPGRVAPVARELASEWGVLEPLQTATSLEGQVEELRAVLEANADLPVTLVGHSWGAMLGFIFSVRHPDFVDKLILVGSAPFGERYASGVEARRLSCLSEDEREEVRVLLAALGDPAAREIGAPPSLGWGTSSPRLTPTIPWRTTPRFWRSRVRSINVCGRRPRSSGRTETC